MPCQSSVIPYRDPLLTCAGLSSSSSNWCLGFVDTKFPINSWQWGVFVLRLGQKGPEAAQEPCGSSHSSAANWAGWGSVLFADWCVFLVEVVVV